jgi:hypothetical protein
MMPGKKTAKPPRTSVRLVRQREAARAALATDDRLRHDERYLASQRKQDFLDGVEYIRKGVRSGDAVEQAFDLATTPGDRRSPAFVTGANAGRALHYPQDQSQDYARRAFAAYGLLYPGRDTKAIAKNLENEITLAAKLEGPAWSDYSLRPDMRLPRR